MIPLVKPSARIQPECLINFGTFVDAFNSSIGMPLMPQERLSWWLILILLMCRSCPYAVMLDQPQSPSIPLVEHFPAARRGFLDRDLNADGKLTVPEFCGSPESLSHKQYQRDFQLLDLDADGHLSFDEFRNHPELVPESERGVFPSRISLHVDELMKKFDTNLPQWDLDRDGELDRTEQSESRFFSTFEDELPQREHILVAESGRQNLRRVVPHLLDHDNDGVITRDEVRQALEISFGLRRPQGELTRFDSGIVINWTHFRHCDGLRPDDCISRDDFIDRGDFGEGADQCFEEADRNQDGFLTFPEWSTLPSQRRDLVYGFMRADTNLDCQVTFEELLKVTPEWQHGIAKHVFPGFDVDRSGAFSIQEYQSTPLADCVYPWHEARHDSNQDGHLSRIEFHWELNQPRFPLPTGLLNNYFQCYDQNRDGVLSPNELKFIIPRAPESRLFRMDRDGGDVELLVDNGLLQSKFVGAPDLSPDGKFLLFDATPATGVNNDFRRSHIMRLGLHGSDRAQTFDLGLGNSPDWSPDGRRIAFSVNPGNPLNLKPGIWVANCDGTGRELLAANLWSPRWSPDGTKILCTNSPDSPHKLFLVDAEKGQRELILDEVVVFGVPDWDPLGKAIAVSLYIDSHRSMCIVDLESHPLTVREVWKSKLDPSLIGATDNSRPNWSADGNEILFTDRSKGKSRLVRVTLKDMHAPPVVVLSEMAHDDVNGVWSADRKQILFCSTQPLTEIPRLKNADRPFASPPATVKKEIE